MCTAGGPAISYSDAKRDGSGLADGAALEGFRLGEVKSFVSKTFPKNRIAIYRRPN
jgi:hypothetical protein